MKFSKEDAEKAAEEIGLDWDKHEFAVADLIKGMNVELEHGTRYADVNVTDDKPVPTAKIALAHLYEFADYYDRLAKMEAEAKESLKEAESPTMSDIPFVPVRPKTSATSNVPPLVIKVDGHVYKLAK